MTETEARDHLATVGLSILSMIAASERLGHTSPAESVMYMTQEPTFAMDYTLWCSRKPGWEDARDRVLLYFDSNGYGTVFAGGLEDHMVANGLPLSELLPYRKETP